MQILSLFSVATFYRVTGRVQSFRVPGFIHVLISYRFILYLTQKVLYPKYFWKHSPVQACITLFLSLLMSSDSSPSIYLHALQIPSPVVFRVTCLKSTCDHKPLVKSHQYLDILQRRVMLSQSDLRLTLHVLPFCPLLWNPELLLTPLHRSLCSGQMLTLSCVVPWPSCCSLPCAPSPACCSRVLPKSTLRQSLSKSHP